MGLPAGSCRAAGQGTPVTLMSQLAVCARGARSVCFLDATGEIFAERRGGKDCSEALHRLSPFFVSVNPIILNAPEGQRGTHKWDGLLPTRYPFIVSQFCTRHTRQDNLHEGRGQRGPRVASLDRAPRHCSADRRGKMRGSTERALLPDSCPAKSERVRLYDGGDGDGDGGGSDGGGGEGDGGGGEGEGGGGVGDGGGGDGDGGGGGEGGGGGDEGGDSLGRFQRTTAKSRWLSPWVITHP